MSDAVMIISRMVRRDYSQEAKMTTKADREPPLQRQQLNGSHWVRLKECGVVREEGSLQLTVVGRG